MEASRIKKYLILSFKKSKLTALYVFGACIIGGFFKALNRDGVDFSPENIKRMLIVFPILYLIVYVLFFCITMWEYYVNDGFIKDDEIQ
ncbi:hypothetical protein [Pseudocolwellia agarivorans]|uniref:hypothetical protein n=1 Tax=Pseudocolwellia agarivorans TaxID=1911682 RepID=UPI003F8820EA